MKNSLVVNGHLVSFDEVGHGKISILFLHGWRSDRRVFAKTIASLDPNLLKIFALDLPGFGESPAPRTALKLQDYSDTVGSFIQNKKLGKVILVGHSFGGRITIKLASSQPDLIKKIVLVDSAGIQRQGLRKSAYHKIAKIVKPVFKAGFMQPLRKSIYSVIGAQDYVETPQLKQTFVNLIAEDLTDSLGKIKQPALILWGDKDTETPVQDAKLMKERIENSKLVILKGAGHFSFLDKPEAFLENLKKFVN